MQRTAVAIMLAGFIFTFFSLPFFGIDLFIDAVGFSLIFNAARALKSWQASFGKAAIAAMALVPLSALQLFFTAAPLALALALLRAAGEAALFYFLAFGFYALLDASKRKAPALAMRFVFYLAAVLTVCGALLPLALPAAGWGLSIALTGCHILLSGSLLFACIFPKSLLY